MRREAEERDAQRRASSNGIPYLALAKVSVNLEALELVAYEKAKEAQMAIIEARDEKLAVIVVDSKYSQTVKMLEQLKGEGYKPTIYIVSRPSLEYAFGYYRFVQKKQKEISGAVQVGSSEAGDVSQQDLGSIIKARNAIIARNDPGAISQLLEIILMGAIANRSSDIHLEPRKGAVHLRFRIDGVLNDVFNQFSGPVYRSMLSRIKLLSNLKLNVRDEPQDGRFTITLTKKDVEVRVAIAPSEFGEVVVMRLLDPDVIALDLQDLGLRPDDLVIIGEQLDRPNGMALNTGPTGSGKTTTLYAFLKHKLNPGIKIITIEDPIEYHLEGVEQTQVKEESGYTFGSGLRSLMRQDPDVILVGEVRDKETAEIAVQAALTGHLVFSTVHANSASAGIPRLLDLGVKPSSLAPALNLLIAQRLVRRVCTSCRVPEKIDEAMEKKIEVFMNAIPDRVDKKKYLDAITIFKPQGCEVCNDTGFRGRIGIYELMMVTPEIQEFIIKEAGQLEIERAVAKTAFVSMQQDGVLKVLSGITTFEEVEETTGKIEWK
jgi:type II secretory ATPase GspE/PulE/Tfp pilus assembly ATPase PilB-like protein